MRTRECPTHGGFSRLNLRANDCRVTVENMQSEIPEHTFAFLYKLRIPRNAVSSGRDAGRARRTTQATCRTTQAARGGARTTRAGRRAQPRMPHPARHSRPKARHQEEQHALGSLLEELGSRRAPAAHRLAEDYTADGHSLQPEYIAPPPTSSVVLLAEDEQLSERQRAEQQVTASPPPSLPPTTSSRTSAMGDASTASDSATGGAKATEDMRTLVRALKTDLSCMSVRLERLEALLSA